MAELICITKNQILDFKLGKKMTVDEIRKSQDLERLRGRHRALFCMAIKKRASPQEIIELMRIVQRLYELGEPFYY